MSGRENKMYIGLDSNNNCDNASYRSVLPGSNLAEYLYIWRLLASGSSEYPNWIDEICFNSQPPKRETTTKTKHKARAAAGKKKRKSGEDSKRSHHKKKTDRKDPNQLVVDEQPVSELPEEYKPSPWITDTNPRRSPYVPQMGDEVMYFWQGHKAYVEAVKRHNIYTIEGRRFPRNHLELKTEEFKVVGIKYHIGPPTTCELKLAFIDPFTRKQTGGSFRIWYHDMADVIDFLVLAQHYDIAMRRNWKMGDHFRAIVRDKWWFGTIESKVPLEAEYPDSLFQCFPVRWNNGETDKMSPWDLEPIDKKNVPKKVGAGNPVTPAEIQQLQYKPQMGEWGDCDQDTECDRILNRLDQVMSLPIAKKFNAPVDLGTLPEYAKIVPYPTDLTTIRTRLILRFYRRRSALQWEVKRLEWNVNAYKEPNSQIAKDAKLVTNILLEVIRDVNIDDVLPLYNQMIGNRNDGDKLEGSSSQSGDESSSLDDDPGSSNKLSAKKRRGMRTYDGKAWIKECRDLLKVLFGSQDSTPFRQPVNEAAYPLYRSVIDHPMDLLIVRERLNADIYQDPIEFAKDVRLIFNNSKAFNIDKKSEISSMTMKLSALFEDNVRDTLRDYKNAAKLKISTTDKRAVDLEDALPGHNQMVGNKTVALDDALPGHNQRVGNTIDGDVIDAISLPSGGESSYEDEVPIYSMTLSLSALFEDNVRDTLRDYENAAKLKIPTTGKSDVDLDDALPLYNQMVDRDKSGGSLKSGDKSGGSLKSGDESGGSLKSGDKSGGSLKSGDDCSSVEDDPPPAKKRRSMRSYDDKAWIEVCRNLFQLLFNSQDSTPFRQPVNDADYLHNRSINFLTVQEKLKTGLYQDPIQFAKDIRLVFNNSKAINTDKKSKIYSMTVRLSTLFEDNIIDTLRDYKNAANRKVLTKGKNSQSDTVPKLDERPGPSGISTRKTKSKVKEVTNGTSQTIHQSMDDSDYTYIESSSSDGDDKECVTNSKKPNQSDDSERSDDQSDDSDRSDDQSDDSDRSDSDVDSTRSTTDSSPSENSSSEDEDVDRQKARTGQTSQRRGSKIKIGEKRTSSKRKTNHHLSHVDDEDEQPPSKKTRIRLGKRTVVYIDTDSEDEA